MRAKLIFKSGRVIKKINVSPSLFEHISKNLAAYQEWLHNAGFKTPDTRIKYSNKQIIFEQEIIDSQPSLEVESVINKICKLNFNMYGLDSNPDNFLGNNDLYFVDFFPLLTHNNKALEQQFDYSPQEALYRYFTLENILLFYVVRVFKKDLSKAFDALRLTKKTLLTSYNTLLPREKVRLLYALKLAEQNKIYEYQKIYTTTKKLTTITEADNKELKEKLLSL